MKKIFISLISLYTFAFSASLPAVLVYEGTTYYYFGNYHYTPSNSFATCAEQIPLYYGEYNSGRFNYYEIQNCSSASSPYRSHYNHVSATYTLTRQTCAENQTIIKDGVCASDVPTCNFGYHNDTAQSGSPCVPDLQCPPTMSYFASEVAWSFDIKTCVTNKNLSEAECLNKGGNYAQLTENLDSASSVIALKYGKGCYDSAWMSQNARTNDLSFLVSGLLPSIPTSYLAQFGNTLFQGGKNLKDLVFDFFKSHPTEAEYALIKYEPDFIDVKIQPDGTYATMDYKLRSEIFDDLGNPKPYDFTTSTNIIPDNVYLGGDIHTFEANIIGTKSFLDDVPLFGLSDTTPVNGVLTSSVQLKNSLFGNELSSFPVTSTLLEKTTLASGEVKTLTQSKINYPDGTYTNVATALTKAIDGTKTYEITATTPIITNSGKKVFEQKTFVTQDSSGAVTNKIPEGAVIKYVDSNGHVVSTPNISGGSASAPSTDTGTINLSNVQNSLNQINKQLSDIKTAINTPPLNVPEFNTALGNFKSGLSNWSLGLDNSVNFINGFLVKFTDVQNSLNTALATFEDKPTISLPSGSCPFTASWYGDTFSVDPCMFVSPYRPILVIFFTLMFSLYTFFFCIRLFFRGE